MILETLIHQHILFTVRMTNTERDYHGYTPMDYDADSEADEVYQMCLSYSEVFDFERKRQRHILILGPNYPAKQSITAS